VLKEWNDMFRIEIVDLNSGEILLTEHYALNRSNEMFARYGYLCYQSTKDERVEIYCNDTRIGSYNFGGAL
jgi:hypothetical protein